MRGTPCSPRARGWGTSAVPEQKLLLLTVLPELAEELGGLNSRLSSSEKGDSEAGDTFCCGRRTKRGMRLRDTSLSSCVLCSCSGRDTPSGTSRMCPPPSIIEAGAGKSRPLRPPRAGAGRDLPAPASPRSRPCPAAHLAALPQRPHRSSVTAQPGAGTWHGRQGCAQRAALPLRLCF